MADLDAFERVFRVEVLRRKNGGEVAPSWSDVKRLVKERRLFGDDEMQDSDFKAQLKEKATELAIAIMSTEPDEDSPKSTKKRKSKQDDLQEERPAKRVKQAATKAPKKRVVSGGDSDVDMEANPKKKKPTHKKTVKKAEQKIEDSDEEEGVPVKKTKTLKEREYSSAVDSDPEARIPPKSPEVTRRSPEEEKRILAAEVAEMSDSALSIVIDGSPVKAKRTKKEGKKTEAKSTKIPKKEKESKGKSKGATADDADEDQIKRLKSFVVACGVRKKWVKEFEGIEDKPKKQIARLKEILTDLGMSGRMSLEKAKAIRERRELAEELEEVVQFEKHRGMPKDEKSRKKQKKSELPSESASEDEETLAANPPARKKNILAFLDDQSEEE